MRAPLKKLAGICLMMGALWGCSKETQHEESLGDALITGNVIQASLAAGENVSTLPSGSQVLFNASGCLQANNMTLTFQNGQWAAEEGLVWADSSSGDGTFTALYPLHEDFTYTQTNLYTDGLLTDVLCAQGTVTAGQGISFQFEHLFSSLTLQLDDALLTNFERLEVTCSAVVSAVDPVTGSVSLSEESHTATLTQLSASGSCQLFVPPAAGMQVTATVYANGGTYTRDLDRQFWESNAAYTYRLRDSQSTKGIRTTADWIAFSQLYNGYASTYNEKTLADFGETTDGVTTYWLLADLDFDSIDCSALKPIGNIESYKAFSDVFDGQGHVISNLTMEPSGGYIGLFGEVSKSGIIKNLVVESCKVNIQASDNSARDGIGLVASINYGTIDGCVVRNCTVRMAQDEAYIGGITSNLVGVINNCKVENSRFTYNCEGSLAPVEIGNISGLLQGTITNCQAIGNKIYHSSNTAKYGVQLGGISGYVTKGLIANCLAANNSFSKTLKTARMGGFCGSLYDKKSSLTIANCLIYNFDTSETGDVGYMGLLLGYLGDLSLNPDNILCPIGGGKFTGDSLRVPNCFGYDPTTFFISGSTEITASDALNTWIIESAPTMSYSNHHFFHWTATAALPATLLEE